ncbi:MAG: hypothetical protein QXT73_00685 [Candidatus Methanomethylicaceae archaeon]
MKAKIILTPERCHIFLPSKKKYIKRFEKYVDDDNGLAVISSDSFEASYIVLGVDLDAKGIAICIPIINVSTHVDNDL